METRLLKKGGKKWIQKAVDKDHVGYCTPMTKVTCTPKRKAFAQTMKKHHGFHKKEEGGSLESLIMMSLNGNKLIPKNLIGSKIDREITTSGKVRDFMHKTIGIPLALNQLGYDLSGGQSPITENSLSEPELNVLRTMVRKKLTEGDSDMVNSKILTYKDYSNSKDINDIKQSINATSDPQTNLKYTLGRANININNGDTTVTDRYNFNDKLTGTDNSFKNYLLEVKRLGIQDPYNQARTLGKFFGSDEQHGSPVDIRINQKAKGGTLIAKNKRHGNLTDADRYPKGEGQGQKYPMVKESDFAGGYTDRSYPIPTEEDAKDALYLAKIHKRPDVIAKIKERYPNLT